MGDRSVQVKIAWDDAALDQFLASMLAARDRTARLIERWPPAPWRPVSWWATSRRVS